MLYCLVLQQAIRLDQKQAQMKRAIQILKRLNQPDRVVNRDRINFTKMMDVIGHPYRSFKSIHITGTNGKGSVAMKTAAILAQSGVRVGLYTSPHLFTFRERIQVNGEMISQQAVSSFIEQIDEISREEGIPLSYFEVMTAAAFMHFKQQDCEYVSLEVGLGGRNDTTNIVTPELSVITSIGLDHMNLLGDTIEKIAFEKAGIIKYNVPVVLGSTASLPLVLQTARQKQSQIYQVPPSEDFQSENRQITRQAIQVLKQLNNHLSISQQHEERGLGASQPCRMELIPPSLLPKWAGRKKVYLDVGHNPAAIEKVRNFMVSRKFKREQITVMYGTSKGKDVYESLSRIQQFAGLIYLVEAKHFRAESATALQSCIGMMRHPQRYRLFEGGDIAKTLMLVVGDPNCQVVLVCGSFFMMPEAKGFFDPSVLELEAENINEIYGLTQDNPTQK